VSRRRKTWSLCGVANKSDVEGMESLVGASCDDRYVIGIDIMGLE